MVRIKRVLSDNEELIELNDSVAQAVDLLSDGSKRVFGEPTTALREDTVLRFDNFYVFEPEAVENLNAILQEIENTDKGRSIIIRNGGTSASGTVTVLPNDGALVNGETQAILYADQSCMVVVQDKDNWLFMRYDTIDGYSTSDGYLTAVSTGDINPDFLELKLIAGDNIAIVKNNPGGNENLQISADIPDLYPDSYQVMVSADDTTHDFIEHKIVAGDNVQITTLNPGGAEELEIAFLEDPVDNKTIVSGMLRDNDGYNDTCPLNTWVSTSDLLGMDWDAYAEYHTDCSVASNNVSITIEYDGYYLVWWQGEATIIPSGGGFSAVRKLALLVNGAHETSLFAAATSLFGNEFEFVNGPTVVYLERNDVVEMGFRLDDTGTFTLRLQRKGGQDSEGSKLSADRIGTLNDMLDGDVATGILSVRNDAYNSAIPSGVWFTLDDCSLNWDAYAENNTTVDTTNAKITIVENGWYLVWWVGECTLGTWGAGPYVKTFNVLVNGLPVSSMGQSSGGMGNTSWENDKYTIMYLKSGDDVEVGFYATSGGAAPILTLAGTGNGDRTTLLAHKLATIIDSNFATGILDVTSTYSNAIPAKGSWQTLDDFVGLTFASYAVNNTVINTTTGTIEIESPGYYMIRWDGTARMYVIAGAAPYDRRIALLVNGSPIEHSQFIEKTFSTGPWWDKEHAIVYLNEGDVVTLGFYATGSGSIQVVISAGRLGLWKIGKEQIGDYHLVKVSEDDTIPNFLEQKVSAGTGIALTTTNPGGDESLQISVDPPLDGYLASATIALTSSDYHTNIPDATWVSLADLDGKFDSYGVNNVTIDAYNTQMTIEVGGYYFIKPGRALMVASGVGVVYAAVAITKNGTPIDYLYDYDQKTGLTTYASFPGSAFGNTLSENVGCVELLEVGDVVTMEAYGFATATRAFTLTRPSSGVRPLSAVLHIHRVGSAQTTSIVGANVVKVSANDTTPGYLEDKIIGDGYVSVTTLNDGGDEDLQISVDLDAYATLYDFNHHHTRHESGGADSIKLDDLATPDDNANLNATTTEHGLLRKLDNDDTHYMDGKGNWTVPAGGGDFQPVFVDWSQAGTFTTATSDGGAANWHNLNCAAASVNISNGDWTVGADGYMQRGSNSDYDGYYVIRAYWDNAAFNPGNMLMQLTKNGGASTSLMWEMTSAVAESGQGAWEWAEYFETTNYCQLQVKHTAGNQNFVVYQFKCIMQRIGSVL